MSDRNDTSYSLKEAIRKKISVTNGTRSIDARDTFYDRKKKGRWRI